MAMEQGLNNLVLPVISNLDTQMQNVLTSQHSLALQLDKLAEVLDSLQSKSTFPTITPYLSKFTETRKRISNVASNVQRIQTRLVKIRALSEQLSKYEDKDKTVVP